MKNKIFTALIVISVVGNFVLGYLYYSSLDSNKEKRLAMDIKCATFLPDLNKEDEANTKTDSKGVTLHSSEVFFSPSENACLSFREIFVAQFDGSKTIEMWEVKNLFTNHKVISQTWLSDPKEYNPHNDFIEKVNKLKMEN